MSFYGSKKDKFIPGSGGDEQLARWDGTSSLQGSVVTLSDTGDLLWTTDGSGDIGAIADNRPDNIYSKTTLNVGTKADEIGSLYVGGTGAAVQPWLIQNSNKDLIFKPQTALTDSFIIIDNFEGDQSSSSKGIKIRSNTIGDGFHEIYSASTDNDLIIDSHSTLRFKVGGNDRLWMTNSSFNFYRYIRPSGANTLDIGDATFTWRTGYFGTSVDINGTAFSDTDIGNWNTAYGWGDHAGLYAPIAHVSDTTNPHSVTASQVGNSTAQWNANQIQSIAVTAPVAGDDAEFLRYNYNAGSPTLTWEAAGGGGITWSTPVDANIVPDTDNAYDLGSAALAFDHIYGANLTLDDGTNKAWTFSHESDDLIITKANSATYGNAIKIRPSAYDGTDSITLYLQTSSTEYMYMGVDATGNVAVVEPSTSISLALGKGGKYLYVDSGTSGPSLLGQGGTIHSLSDVDITSGKVLKVAGTQVVGSQQAAEANVGAMTTVGANTGTAGAGLSLIGDTTSVDQSSNIMNDFKALQEDVVALQTTVNSLLAKLRSNSGSGHGLLSD